MRKMLIERTIVVVANEGLDKTTTKAIANGMGINEGYIYRHFADKTELLAKTFDMLDEEFITQVVRHLPIMYMHGLALELRCRMLFEAVWKFLLGNKEKCFTYVRYYYSPYFSRYSADGHKERCASLIDTFQVAFKEEADVWMILNHILNVMLYFAIKVHNDEIPKDNDYSEHVFRIIYVSVKQYFKENEGDKH